LRRIASDLIEEALELEKAFREKPPRPANEDGNAVA
jgi:hypothetical protein